MLTVTKLAPCCQDNALTLSSPQDTKALVFWVNVLSVVHDSKLYLSRYIVKGAEPQRLILPRTVFRVSSGL